MKRKSSFQKTLRMRLSNWWTKNNSDDLFIKPRTDSQHSHVAAARPNGRALLQMFTIHLRRCDLNVSKLAGELVKGRNKELIKWMELSRAASQKTGSIGWMLVVQNKQRQPLVFYPGYIETYLERDAIKRLEKLKPRISECVNVTPKRGTTLINCVHLEDLLTTLCPSDVSVAVKKTGWYK